jgi:hypothetical protein
MRDNGIRWRMKAYVKLKLLFWWAMGNATRDDSNQIGDAKSHTSWCIFPIISGYQGRDMGSWRTGPMSRPLSRAVNIRQAQAACISSRERSAHKQIRGPEY